MMYQKFWKGMENVKHSPQKFQSLLLAMIAAFGNSQQGHCGSEQIFKF